MWFPEDSFSGTKQVSVASVFRLHPADPYAEKLKTLFLVQIGTSNVKACSRFINTHFLKTLVNCYIYYCLIF